MIKCKDLTINRDDKILLENFNQSFHRGQFWAVLGKNGVGKTTFLNALAGFYPQSSGVIQLDNQDLSSLSILVRAQKISYLSQIHEASLDCSVAQSIAYGRYAWQQKIYDNQQEQEIVEAAIESMELSKIQDKNILQLSGGERRKVELATTIAQNGEVFLLDEPLNHLDLNFRIKLMKLLNNLSQDKLIILVTHDLQFVQKYCSHVLMFASQNSWLAGDVTSVMTKENLNKMLDINYDEIVL